MPCYNITQMGDGEGKEKKENSLERTKKTKVSQLNENAIVDLIRDLLAERVNEFAINSKAPLSYYLKLQQAASKPAKNVKKFTKTRYSVDDVRETS